ncbi:MAG: hypothetical protein GQ575_02340 [Deltaproteobacteria bacterium]|nr:hypothetical protein [Deltaproteobacteria bacterium]
MIPSVIASQVERGIEDFLRTTFLRISLLLRTFYSGNGERQLSGGRRKL